MTQEKTLHDRIKEDINTSLRAGDQHRTDILRTLLGDAVKEARKKEIRLPTDQEMIGFLRKFVTNAGVMAQSFDKAGRGADAAKSRAEIEILTAYLPAGVSDDDVRAFLTELKASGAIPAGNAGLGAAVKALKDKYADAFDGRTMTQIAKEVVAG